MKKIRTVNKRKQIIYIIIVLMLCNFIMPGNVYAAQEDDSGVIFAPFFKFVTFLCDSIMQFMQNTFISQDKIEVQEGIWDFQYSPAIIFSGTVPAFDINFITPNQKVSSDYIDFLNKNEDKYFDEIQNDGGTNVSEEQYNNYFAAIKEKEGIQQITDSHINAIPGVARTSVTHKMYYEETRGEKTYFCLEYFVETTWHLEIESKTYNYKKYEYEINENFMNDLVVYESTASKLQGTIATWYNALRRISLVGLLSVLIYIGINIILSSISGKENSKYKKMLVDWLIAICLLFTLHYIMNVTIVITQKISRILNNGQTDTLLNTLRIEIEQGENWEQVTAQVIMYIVMTIFTVMFTFQYLKRVLYIGFFTIIAPLITLTYPLDKIKDSKAQAFTIWIREYIFTALIQVIHLVVYYALVGSALDLVEVYPLYGVLAIAFISQGEKIIRKMFGFDNVTSVGTMGAAATGGLVATALNKLQKVSKPSKKTQQSNNNIRTTSNSPMTNSSVNGANTNSEMNIKGGAKSLAGRYVLPATKSVARATLSTLAGIPGAMLGFAAGISQGDISAALTGAAAGGKAGSGLGQKVANGVNFGNIKTSINNVQDTFNEGAYGEQYAQNMRMAREFKQTKEYKELKDEFGDLLTDEKLGEILNAAKKEQENTKK